MTQTFGPAFSEKLDGPRIRRQIDVLRDYILTRSSWGWWMSLKEMSDDTGISEASLSSDLRHLRKKSFGSYRVEKRRRRPGTWEYAVFPPDPKPEQLKLVEEK